MGKRYLKGYHFVQTFLKGKGKSGHLTNNPPQSLDPKFETLDWVDAVVLSWLWNALTPEVSVTYMFMKKTKNLWDSCKANYFKVVDAAQTYEIKMRISNIKQGNYSNQMLQGEG